MNAWLSMTLLLVLAGGEDYGGHWEGAIAIPGEPIAIRVDLVFGATWTGTMDILEQGVQGAPLSVALSTEGITLISDLPGAPTFKGRLANGAIEGEFAQGGNTFPFRLGRERAKPRARPQDPLPPYPYREEEVGYQNGKIRLAGTLTIPDGEGPFPAVVLITGSGAQNRNEELLGHRPFLVLADHLTRAGIAVLRVDDRGVGGSSGNVRDATTADFAGDVLAGVRFLKEHAGIAGEAIGVLGHSEGGLVGPLAASRSSDIAFVVMLAGTGVTGAEILLAQGELIARSGGASEAQIAQTLALQKRTFALLRSGKDSTTIQAEIDATAHELQAGLSESERQGVAQQSEGSLREYLTPWFRFFISYDPRIALRSVTVPVLALNGELDLQVPADQNLPEIEKALREAGNKDVTIKRFPKMNHLFQVCATGSPAEYAHIDETINPAVLDCVTRWILERFGPDR